MKKIILIVCLIMLNVSAGVCYALEISRNENNIGIGYVRLGMNIDDVIEEYGPPEKKELHDYCWTPSPNLTLRVREGIALFGSGNVILIDLNQKQLTDGFVNNEDKNTMSNGIYIGMPVEELSEILGISVEEITNDPQKYPNLELNSYVRFVTIHNCDDAQRILIGHSNDIVISIKIQEKPVLGW